MLRALIVDDESVARAMLQQMLAEEADIEVVGTCAGGEEAVQAILADRPDLVFLDICMPDLDGFEVLARVPEDRRPAVIFVTAHDEHAVDAFRVRALDYLLKPFDEERLHETLERARAVISGPDRAAVARSLADLLTRAGLETGGPRPRRLAVKDGDETVVIALNDVDWVESMANYVRLHAGKNGYLVRGTLKSLEDRLDPERFVRIHRSIIVNVDRVARLSPLGHGDQVVILKNGRKLTASRRYRQRLETLLQSL